MRFFIALSATFAFACSGASSTTTSNLPSNVAGDYTVDVTNTSANACNFNNWTQGTSTNGIPVTITQNGSQVTATVTGIVGVFMMANLGTNSFSGTLGGNQASLQSASQPKTQGNCTYTTSATIGVSFSGDTMQGTVTYNRATNGASACASLASCENTQSFSGARPPTGG